MNIKIVVDNITYTGLIGEHGLSIILEDDKYKILFDTGKSAEVLENNLKMLGENKKFDYIVLSHGHYDHCNGLKYIIREKLYNKIFVGEGSLIDRFYNGKYIGIANEIKEFLKKEAIFIDNHIKIDNDFYIFKINEREFCYEPENFVDKDGNIDLVLDEIALYYRGVLLTGCSHSGIINVIETAKQFGDIKFVVGGFHLINSSDNYLDLVYNYLKHQDFNFMPLHCTGFYAISKLSNLKNFVLGYSGKILKLEG
ncbi:MBL fold metallo-hydrolase [Methanocaldococcus indicus]|uniref:MBL fold metallo-hydrolase n=1 Tax=Methanocaldococcus indicus TaxID=213231 RepID=UPI003C6D90EA